MRNIIKERKSNKANDIVALGRGKLKIVPAIDGAAPSSKTTAISGSTRNKQKKPGQQQPGGKISKQYFAEVANKDTFSPPRIRHITGKGIRGKDRPNTRDTDCMSLPAVPVKN